MWYMSPETLMPTNDKINFYPGLEDWAPASTGVSLPYKAWRIMAGYNNGTPYTHYVPPDKITMGFTSIPGFVDLPNGAWRITPDTVSINFNQYASFDIDSYPWKAWWTNAVIISDGDVVETEHPDMNIGGSQSNYPTWSSPNMDGGGLAGHLDDEDMSYNPGEWTGISAVNIGMKGRMFALNNAEAQTFLGAFRSESFLEAFTEGIAAKAMQLLFKADIYSGIDRIKVFPCQVPADDLEPFVNGGNGSEIKMFGYVPIPTSEGGMLAYWCNRPIREYDMGTCELDMWGYNQGWLFENVQWSLYLPFAGTFSLSLLSNDPVSVRLVIDFTTGQGQYKVTQNGQLIGTYKAMIGYDMPYSMAEGAASANFFGNLAPLLLLGAGLAAPVIGEIGGTALGSGMASAGMSGALGGTTLGQTLTAGSVGAEMYGKTLGGIAGKALTGASVASKALSHTSPIITNTPSAGGILDFNSYPRVRLIAKIPKLYKDALGYPELIGVNRSQAVDAVSQMSGFIVCENYRSDLIVATKDEKVLINQLMNSGVFV